MSESVIDLGDLTHERARPEAPSPMPRRSRPYRAALAALALLLLASIAGSARVAPPPAPKIIPARLGDTTFVSDNRLFLVTAPGLPPGREQRSTITMYALPSGAPLGRTTVSVTGAIFDVTAVGPTLLVSYQLNGIGVETTVALAAGTDRVVWRRPARLLGLSRTRGLALLRDSTENGPVRWYAVDLATGAERWSLDQPATGDMTPADLGDPAPGEAVDLYPRKLVSVDLAGRLVVRDGYTGAITATRTIPVPADWRRRGTAIWPTGDLILLGDHDSTTAYSVADLAERWRAPADLYSAFVGGDCVRVVCLFNPRGFGARILDRDTGRLLWASDKLAYAAEVGQYLLAGDGDGTARSQSLEVIDVATGRPRGTFGPWQLLGPLLPGGRVLGLRQQQAGDMVWYASLDPATLGVRIIGRAREVSGDCQTTAQVMICRRLDASVGIWRLTDAG